MNPRVRDPAGTGAQVATLGGKEQRASRKRRLPARCKRDHESTLREDPQQAVLGAPCQQAGLAFLGACVPGLLAREAKAEVVEERAQGMVRGGRIPASLAS